MCSTVECNKTVQVVKVVPPLLAALPAPVLLGGTENRGSEPVKRETSPQSLSNLSVEFPDLEAQLPQKQECSVKLQKIEIGAAMTWNQYHARAAQEGGYLPTVAQLEAAGVDTGLDQWVPIDKINAFANIGTHKYRVEVPQWGPKSVSNPSRGLKFFYVKPDTGERKMKASQADSKALAEHRKSVKEQGCVELVLQWCIDGVCCFWIPMCFFMAAANVLTTCESRVDNYLKVYSLFSFLAEPVRRTLLVLCAYAGHDVCFKWLQNARFITGAVGFALMIWGWVIYNNTTDELCYDPARPGQDHDINPRTLLYVFLVLQAVFLSLACCGLAGLFCKTAFE